MNAPNLPPTISLTAPTNGDIYPAPATVTLKANASDTDGTIAKVEFYNGANLIGSKAQSPYSYDWTDVAAGNYTITAKAYDDAGVITTSGAVNVTVNALPTVTITSPTSGSISNAPATLNIAANASDSAGGTITKVDFYNGTTLLGSDTTAPYSFNWTSVPAGDYILTAKAYDNLNGTTTSSEVNVTVNALPTVSITSPTGGSISNAPGSFNITATASDTDGTISKVEFYKGATLLGTSTTSPYSYAWSGVAAGSYSLTAKAYDNTGAITTSSAVVVTVNALPTVAITSPTSGSISNAPGSFTITATASDTDGTIAKVEFYNGTTLLGSDTTSPYSFSWTSIPAGNYVLTAKAFDNTGAVITSDAVNVTANSLPSVSLTTPLNGSTYQAPASIVLNANATDTDGTIAKVEFYKGTTLLGTATTLPYSYTWSGVAASSYSLTAKAYDNTGAVKSSNPVVVTVNALPVVSITSPANGSILNAPGSFTITATASDNDGTIAKVEFYNGTTLLGTSTTSPYSYAWSGVAAGSYSLTAKAYDNTGAITTSGAVNVTVNALPSVSLTAPLNGSAYQAPALITLNANATDTDGSITKVDFYNGATLLGSDTTLPYSYPWSGVAAGNYSLTAKAYDNTGAITTSSAVVVTVNALPTVTITSPTSGSISNAPGSFTITATASDTDGTIAKVEFYNGTTLLGTSTTSPYSYAWSGVAAGSYSLTAKAYDNSGAVITASAVNVTVNALPVANLTAPANNAAYNAPASISLAATAIDTDGTISKVEFYSGTTLLGSDTSEPYGFNWTTVPAGSYTVTAKAYDNAGGITSSGSVAISVNAMPTVSITSPVNNTSIAPPANGPANVTIEADASDSDGSVNRVEFYSGATLLGTDTTAPYSYTWSGVTSGTYSLTAKVYDNAGTIGVGVSSPVTITVNKLPTVSMTTNASTYAAPATIVLNASAADDDGTISKVEFYSGGVLLSGSTDTTAPYSFSWNSVPAGTYTLTAKAYDNAGAVVASEPVAITVTGAGNTKPVVNNVTPVTNATYQPSDTIPLRVLAYDPDSTGLVAKIEVLIDGQAYGSWSNINLQVTAKSTVLPALSVGVHNIQTKVTDNAGEFTTVTTPVTVAATAVGDIAPTVALQLPFNNSVYMQQTTTDPVVITLVASAADADGSVNRVEFFQVVSGGENYLGTSTSAPYGLNLLAPAGTFVLKAYAYDNLGVKTASTTATVVVNAPTPSDIAPTVQLNSPVDGAILQAPATVSISATASDSDGSINRVELGVNGSLFTVWDQFEAQPYQAQINIPTPGTYTFQIRAFDNLGKVTYTGVKTITVNAAPTVSLTVPNTSYVAPATIDLTAVPADSDGVADPITKVEFYNGSTLLGSDTTSPYSYSWTSVAAGNYNVTAKAYDSRGGVGASQVIPVTVFPPNGLPSVALTAPAQNAVFAASGGSITLSANASDSDGISKVEFYANGSLLYTDVAAPYAYTWSNAAAGSYAITAKAYDSLGGASIANAVNITVNTLPTVSITGPVGGTIVNAPAAITITANAADSDVGGSISKVEFYNGSTLLSSDTASPYSYTWSGAAAGNYSLTAKAYDNLGGVTTSSAVNVTVNALPTVSITSPTGGSISNAPGSFNITATASDTDGTISKVEFYKGATLLGTSTTSPYSYAWSGVAAGSYSLTAKAYDNTGAITTSSAVVVTVNALPTVAITSPTSGSISNAPGSFTITATASDTDGTIAKVEFYNGTTLLGSDTTSPYSFSWTSIPAGNYVLTAKAYDNTGAITTSSAVNVTANALPTVAITSPTGGSISNAPGSFTITATAGDTDGTIAKVEFYNGVTLLNTDTAAPYSYAWNGVAAGSYSLTAKAYDNTGALNTSSIVAVKVNALPTGNIATPTQGAKFMAPVTVTISAAASDTDGTINKVEFYNGASLLNSDNAAPYSYDWNSVGAGSYTLTAKIYDNDGGVFTTSAVGFTVTQPPTVVLTSPANMSAYTTPASITLSANATDADGIAKVEFYDNGTLLNTDSAAPYSYVWHDAASGIHSLTAKAYDNAGGYTESGPSVITVSPPPSPVTYDYDELGRLIGVHH